MDVSNYELTEEQTELFNKLNSKQKQLVLAKLSNESIGQAHERIYGTSKRKSKDKHIHSKLASEILNKPELVNFIEAYEKKVIDESVTESIISRQEALELLSAMGRSKLTDVLELKNIEVEDKEGNTVPKAVVAFKGLDNLNNRGAASLQEIKVNPTTGEITFKTHDQKAAIKQIADMMGYNREADAETAVLTQEERILNMTKNHAVTDEKLN